MSLKKTYGYDNNYILKSRQIIEGPLDVHPSKNAIVIHYSVDARVLSEDLQTMGADLKQCRKMYTSDITLYIHNYIPICLNLKVTTVL